MQNGEQFWRGTGVTVTQQCEHDATESPSLYFLLCIFYHHLRKYLEMGDIRIRSTGNYSGVMGKREVGWPL